MITFKADITPIPQNNGKFGNGYAYQPKRVTDYKNALGLIAKAAMKGREPLSGQLKIEVAFAKNRKADSQSFGDIDNLLKSTFDALKGICYRDDAQIVEVLATKIKSKIPYLEVKIWEVLTHESAF